MSAREDRAPFGVGGKHHSQRNEQQDRSCKCRSMVGGPRGHERKAQVDTERLERRSLRVVERKARLHDQPPTRYIGLRVLEIVQSTYLGHEFRDNVQIIDRWRRRLLLVLVVVVVVVAARDVGWHLIGSLLYSSGLRFRLQEGPTPQLSNVSRRMSQSASLGVLEALVEQQPNAGARQDARWNEGMLDHQVDHMAHQGTLHRDVCAEALTQALECR